MTLLRCIGVGVVADSTSPDGLTADCSLSRTEPSRGILSRVPNCTLLRQPRSELHFSARSSRGTYKSRGADGACRLGRAIHRFLHPLPQRIVAVPCRCALAL